MPTALGVESSRTTESFPQADRINQHRVWLSLRWFNPFDRVDSVDRLVERRHLVDTRALGARNEVGLREVDPSCLVDLDCPQERGGPVSRD